MNKKRVYDVGLAVFIILLLMFSICSIGKHYSYDREIKMIYKLKPNESIVEVAKRFRVNPANIKNDNGYLMFIVK